MQSCTLDRDLHVCNVMQQCNVQRNASSGQALDTLQKGVPRAVLHQMRKTMANGMHVMSCSQYLRRHPKADTIKGRKDIKLNTKNYQPCNINQYQSIFAFYTVKSILNHI